MAAKNFVLRSVYLEPEIDGYLRELAFTQNISKNDLIRRYITVGAGAELKEALETEPARLKNGEQMIWGLLRAARGADLLSAGNTVKGKPSSLDHARNLLFGRNESIKVPSSSSATKSAGSLGAASASRAASANTPSGAAKRKPAGATMMLSAKPKSSKLAKAKTARAKKSAVRKAAAKKKS